MKTLINTIAGISAAALALVASVIGFNQPMIITALTTLFWLLALGAISTVAHQLTK